MPALSEKKHSRHYSERAFLRKIARFGNVVFLRDAVAMFFCLKDPETPRTVKALIVAALGYFIFPLDAIPDLAPVIGFLDDAGVIAAALAAIVSRIQPRHREQAEGLLKKLRRDQRQR